MEQHNIDSRFKEGLGNISRQPSADAWARLQSQMAAPAAPETVAPVEEKEEKKVILWWRYAAAAVLLVFFTTVLFRLQQPSGTAPTLARVETPNNATQKATQPEAITEKADGKIKPALKEMQPTENATLLAQKTADKPTGTENRNENGSTMKTAGKTTRNLETSQLAAAPKEQQKTEQETAGPEPQPAPEKQLIASSDSKPKTEASNPEPANKAIEVIIKRSPAPVLVAMNTAEPEENQTAEDRKPTLRGLFKQAKNLKNGESLDPAALGIDQNSKLAVNARNIRSKVSQFID